MASKLQRDAKKLSRHLALIRRSRGMPDVFGFVAGWSDELVLLHSFNSEVFCLDGYDVIRPRDIRGVCYFDNPSYWRYRALRRLKIRPARPPAISLVSVRALLSSVNALYPLMSVHRETPSRRTTYVGPVIGMAERSFTMADADYFGEWTGPRRLQYAEVTRVCFDGGFLRASAMTAQKFRVRRP